jgi:S-adenosylmethionine hydrolase
MVTSSSSLGRAADPVICLMTDYGWEDSYVAQLKGVIYTINPEARIQDLNHDVAPYDIAEGAYLLDQSAAEFPSGTIFVVVVDPEVGSDRDPVLLQTAQGKFFVGPDNGLFSQVIAREGLGRAWKLDRASYFRPGALSHTFHGRDIFAPIAAHLAAGMDPVRLGTPLRTLTTLPGAEAAISGNLISTQVVHIDHFGNVVLNLREGTDAAARLKSGTLVRVTIGRQNYSAPFVDSYAEVDKGRLILLYGGNGQLELAVNQGSAAVKLRVQPGTPIFLKP